MLSAQRQTVLGATRSRPSRVLCGDQPRAEAPANPSWEDPAIPSCALMLLLLVDAGPASTVLAADLDGDGQGDTLSFHVAQDGTRGFLQLTLAGDATPHTSPIYPAWKAVAGRLDRTAADLVVLGTWTRKGTRPGEPPRRSIWVVAFEGGRWVERWRGSALARPFDDFTLEDIDGDGQAELVVRECEGAAPGFTAYTWQGFGFAGRARLLAPCHDHAITGQRQRLSGGRPWKYD